MARKKFEILLARTTGFCMGVRRALRMALNAADVPGYPSPIRTHGPLIHNRQVLQVLEKRGVLSTDESGSDDAGTLVIRAHGLSREDQEKLRKRCHMLLDATCPHVSRVQGILDDYARQGYMCIVVGDAGHAEVNGLLSYTGGAGYAVAGPDEVDALPPADKVAVVAQTTQDEETFGRTVERIRARYGECMVFETICGSTGRRQAEVRELAKQADAMIVVGGFNSANTRRLTEISAATGTPTFHVETERQLDVDEILQYDTVGLAAGASTPNWMIRKVARRLADSHRRRTSLSRYLARTFLRGLIDANVYAAGGAAALTFAVSHLLRQPPRAVALCMAVSFFFVLAQQLLNQYARRESLYLSEPDRAEFFMANERALLWLGVSASLSSLLLAFFLGWWPFGLVVLGSAAGLMYRFRLPRSLAVRIGLRSMEQLPGSKELFVGLAWATLAALVPALARSATAGLWKGTAIGFVASFLMVFQRTLLLDLRDVETDQLVGRENLAGLLGGRTAGRLFLALVAALVLVIVGGGCVARWTTSFCYPLLLSVPYALASYVMLRRGGPPGGREGETAEALVDGQFYALGLAALVWLWVGAAASLFG